MRIFRVVFLCLLFILNIGYVQSSDVKDLTVDLYDRQLRLFYNGDLDFTMPEPFTQEATYIFYRQASEANYSILLNSLKEIKQRFNLNDWMYYELVKSASDNIFKDRHPNYRIMAQWYVLYRSGYNVRLYHDQSRTYLYAAVSEKVYGLPYIEVESRMYCEISSYFYRGSKDYGKIFTSSALPVNTTGKMFKLSLSEMPDVFSDELISRELSFFHKGQEYKLNVQGSKPSIAFQRTYPQLGLLSYIDVPLSEAAYKSVIEPFRGFIKGMNEYEAARLILSFTRLAFEYKTDDEAYREGNLNFSPEMTLLAPYSDCEDRAILYSYMVKELIGLETVLLEYPSHISVAVNFSEPLGTSFKYNGNIYSVCEPTGPQDELEIGQLSKNMAEKSFKVYRQ